jgi:uncharacterized protein
MKIVDCDGHVAEPFSLYPQYCEPEFRDRVPRRIEKNGERRVIVDGKEYPDFVKYVGRPLGMEDDAKIPRPVQQAAISQGGIDPYVRLRDMDLEGIDIAILYPSGATSLCVIENPELETAVYRAYNRWLAEYCSANTGRLKGMILISMPHPHLGVQEVLRVADEPWVVGILLSPHMDDYNLDHPRFNPIFEVAQHHNLPICFHAGAGRPPYAIGTNESSSNLFLMHAFAHPFEQMRAMASLMGGGVFDHFPGLRAGFIECGVGWVPWWLDWLEEHAKNLPDHVPFMILFGSDYPHWDCGFPGAVRKMRDRKIPEASIRKIFWDNAVRLHTRLLAVLVGDEHFSIKSEVAYGKHGASGQQ